MNKEEVRVVIDQENGIGFSKNLNLNGYLFTRKNSFIIFEMKNVEDVKICHIKYIYFDDVKDLITIMVHACNFWQGNKIQFIFFKEKHKNVSAIKFLENLNFRKEILVDHKWKYPFDCKIDEKNQCSCKVFTLCK